MACTMRDNTRAVSAIGSPRAICEPALVITSGWPPSSLTATSSEMRVRVEAFSKISATDFAVERARLLAPSCGRLEAIGRVEQREQAFGSEVAELEQVPHQLSFREHAIDDLDAFVELGRC